MKKKRLNKSMGQARAEVKPQINNKLQVQQNQKTMYQAYNNNIGKLVAYG